jgi:hypothetical protein
MSDDPREHLRTASDRIAEAAEGTEGEASERLANLADRVAGFAERDTGPDHGALDTVMYKLNELADEVGGETGETISRARSDVLEFRKTVEGV